MKHKSFWQNCNRSIRYGDRAAKNLSFEIHVKKTAFAAGAFSGLDKALKDIQILSRFGGASIEGDSRFWLLHIVYFLNRSEPGLLLVQVHFAGP